MRKLLFMTLCLLLVVTGCSALPGEAIQTMVAVLPDNRAPAGPLGGQLAALPTPAPVAATPTPPSSLISFPTPGPTVVGPLATLTAVAGLLPTMDLDATPYAVPYRGVPIFIEFQARW